MTALVEKKYLTLFQCVNVLTQFNKVRQYFFILNLNYNYFVFVQTKLYNFLLSIIKEKINKKKFISVIEGKLSTSLLFRNIKPSTL